MNNIDDILGKKSHAEFEEFPIDGICDYQIAFGQACYHPLEKMRVDEKNKKVWVICVQEHVKEVPWSLITDG
jgi:hypothetical protein